MSDKKTSGYVTGLISIIVTVALFSIVLSQEWNLATQIFTTVGLITAGLAGGCFWKPETFGPIAEEFYNRFAQDAGDSRGSKYKQTQHQPKNSPQAFTKRGNVIIKQNFYGNKKRRSKRGSGWVAAIPIVLLIIGVLVVFATWPKLQIQTKSFDGIVDSSNKEFFIKATAWNRGGSISGYSIITPTVCLSARGEGVTCTHQGYDEMIDCINSMCGNVLPGGLLPERTFNFKINETYEEIEFKIIADGVFGPFPVAHAEKHFSCIKIDTQYNCTESN